MKKDNKKISDVEDAKSRLKGKDLHFPEERLCANILSYASQFVISDLGRERDDTFYSQRRNS